MNYSFKLKSLVLFAVAATVSLGATPAVAASKSAKSSPIYQCDLADGSRAYADNRCKGATAVKRWAPVKVPMGIQKTGKKPPQSEKEMLLKSLTLGSKDPYVDCKEKGGHYKLYDKLCVLPAKKDPNKIIRIR